MPEKNYLEEIEEILRKTEGEAPARSRRWAFRLFRGLPAIRLSRPSWMPALSPSKLMIAGVGALVLAMIFRAVYRGLMAPFIWAGLGLFVLAYLYFLISPSRPRYEKRWRGKPIEDEPASPWERLRRLIR